jgi:hypothetical protein
MSGVLLRHLLQRHVVVRFVDIGGIVDHHCLNFLSIKKYTLVLVCA